MLSTRCFRREPYKQQKPRQPKLIKIGTFCTYEFVLAFAYSITHTTAWITIKYAAYIWMHEPTSATVVKYGGTVYTARLSLSSMAILYNVLWLYCTLVYSLVLYMYERSRAVDFPVYARRKSVSQVIIKSTAANSRCCPSLYELCATHVCAPQLLVRLIMSITQRAFPVRLPPYSQCIAVWTIISHERARSTQIS